MNQNITDDRPIISPGFEGQIGNQLFVVAATLGFAWDYNARPIFPNLSMEKNRTSYNRGLLFYRLDHSPSPRPLEYIFREKIWYSADRIPFYGNDLMIEGYFQSWKHFHSHRDELLAVLAPSPFVADYLSEKYGNLISNPKTVAIHIRTSGKMPHEKRYQPFLGIEYVKRATDLFPGDFLFIIFSDRINWCKKHLSSLNRNFIFIEGNDGIEDLFLMSMMRHIIISNSTYSWWGAYLNQHPEKRVIAPEYWGGNPPPPHTRDLFLPEWEILPVPPILPYPEDMFDYDETQSWDGNQ